MLTARDRLGVLLARRPFAVLATMNGDAPHQSVVAFACDEADTLYFATPRASRKWEDLSRSQRVSVLVDDRTHTPADLHSATAASAAGTASVCTDCDRDRARDALVARHPQLDEFVDSPSTDLFRLSIESWYVVSGFQRVERVDVGVGT